VFQLYSTEEKYKCINEHKTDARIFLLFFLPLLLIVPLFSLTLQENRDQYPDPQKEGRALNLIKFEGDVAFELSPTNFIKKEEF